MLNAIASVTFVQYAHLMLTLWFGLARIRGLLQEGGKKWDG